MSDSSGNEVRRRRSIRWWVVRVSAVAGVLTVLVILSGAIGIVRLTDARTRLADSIDPAIRTAQQVATSYVDQETSVRGFALGREESYLEPYEAGRALEREGLDSLRDLVRADPRAMTNLAAVVTAGDVWRTRYAMPAVAAVRGGQPGAVITLNETGKVLFDQLRQALSGQMSYLEQVRATARDQLDRAATWLTWIAALIAAMLVFGITATLVGVRRGITLPLGQLTDRVRTVAAGDFHHAVRSDGPRELAMLGADVDSMRLRILGALTAAEDSRRQLDARTRDLERSNAELEQFAYVASHDLQEPLRKVASFCQLLEARYHDQLDDRGRQYIDFAVDGASRMQKLINDLLAFSRVGRLSSEATIVDGDALMAQAQRNLASAIEETGAIITADPLPPLRGDTSLLVTTLQNLIGNAIKFHKPDQAPRIRFTVADEGDHWQFTCADDGIGIDPQYADRIFAIFQRLHPKSVYTGTGIGLAMCRKIVEYHGGRIWLDPSRSAEGGGSTFCFTLPKVPSVGSDIRTEEAQHV